MFLYCYGDSNTYGYDPRSFGGGRYPAGIRWTSLLEASGCSLYNDGMNGRCIPTTRYERELLAASFRKQLARLSEAETADACFFLMLGTNDLLMQKDPNAETVAERMADLLTWLKTQPVFHHLGPRLILAAPARLKEGSWVDTPAAITESIRLQERYRELAKTNAISCFLPNSDELTLCSDGVHFTEKDHHRFAEMVLKYLTDYSPKYRTALL